MGSRSSRRRGKPNGPDPLVELQKIYDSLPTIECRGECWDSCYSYGMTPIEQRAIEIRTGSTLPLAHAGRCQKLTMFGRCGIYDVRPLICRLWGLTRAMACNYGCRPEGGFMSNRECYLLIARVHELSGDHRSAAVLRDHWEDPVRAAESERRLRASEDRRADAFALKRYIAERDGTAVYLDAGGGCSTKPNRQSTTSRWYTGR